jgi:hypothetical protein
MTTEACAVCGEPISGDSIVITAVDDDGVDRMLVCSIRCASAITSPGLGLIGEGSD